MNIQVDPTSSNLASAMLNSKIRPRAVVGYGVKIFRPSPLNYITRSPGECAQTIVILAGKTWYRRHFSTRFRKNVVASKQVKNTVTVFTFFDQQKGLVTSNKNNWATYNTNKEYRRLIVRVINFLSHFAKNGQSDLVLVLVLVLKRSSWINTWIVGKKSPKIASSR